MTRLAALSIAMLLAIVTLGCVPFQGGLPPVSAGGESASLAGTSWTLVSFGDGTAAAAQPATLIFEKDQPRAGGRGGVNLYGGQVSASGLSLTFSQVFSTMMAGPQALMEQEAKYLKALDQVRGYQVLNDQLTLVDSSAAVLLTFSRAPAV
jgi:putative lipoprotein